MRRRFSSQHNPVDNRQRNARRQRVRKLTFDSLEDRRLLAGLNVFVYDDANDSGGWESSSESSIAEQVVYVDQNDDGHLGSDEPYAITGADGKALIDNLANGLAILRLLGSSSPAIAVPVSDSIAMVDVNLAGKKSLGNSAPTLNSIADQSVDEDGSLSLSRSIFEKASSDADNDPLWYFIVGKPSNGVLIWSVEAGGTYQPDENYYGTDSIVVRAFDGKSWSPEMALDITVNSVDDLPTAIEFAGGSIPENHQGFVIGPITIIDIDGGPNFIQLSPENVYEIQDGKLKLAGSTSLNYEESPSIDVTFLVTVGDDETTVLSFTASLPVLNRNDAPTALEFQGQVRVEEFVAGFEFGSIQVVDEDVADQYDFHLSDDRFEVVDGKLALKAGDFLVFADAPSVAITITAISQTSSDAISETLNIEVVRAAPPWQNKNWALDVNNDGLLTPLDVLVVINALNRIGAAPLDRLPPPGSASFVDVNGDRFLSPLDALILINAINRQSRESEGGSSEGGSNGSGNQNESGGDVGEGEGPSSPSAPRQVAEEVEKTGRVSNTVNTNSSAFPIDDDNLSPSHTRKAARRVR